MFKSLADKIKTIFSGDETGIKVVGNNWFARYSNAFEDREKEFFPVKAIDQYIDRVDHGVVPLPELWVWHEPIVIGKAKGIARLGLFVVGWGTFADTPVGRAAKTYLSKNKAKNSHGFTFAPESFKDSAYHEYNTFEISVLPFGKGVEANAYTNLEVKSMAMNEEKKKFLVEMFGDETAGKLIADTDKASKALEEAGVAFKDFANIANLKQGDDEDEEEDVPEDDDKMDDEDDDKSASSSLKSLVAENVGSIAEIADGQLQTAKAVNALNEMVQKLTTELKEQQTASEKALSVLRKENEKLRKELDLTPRGKQASQSSETETEDEDGNLLSSLKDKESGEKDGFWNFALEND